MYSNINFTEECLGAVVHLPVKDLRISLTSECNMACTYCHNENLNGNYRHTGSQLSLEQVIYIINEAMRFEIRSVKFTGGETLRYPFTDLCKICRYIKDNHKRIAIGINTNGIFRDKLLHLVRERLVDKVVFGIDLFDGVVSKISSIGSSSRDVLNTVLAVKGQGCTVEIDMVYNNDYKNLHNMASWAQKNNVRLKVLELIDDQVSDSPDQHYEEAIERLIKDLKLSAGIDRVYNDPYAFNPNDNDKTRISFYHSLCRTRECLRCRWMHMRITSQGKAKPCLQNPETEFPLLEGNFDTNMRKAILAIGIPPQRKILSA
jgi:cyclic pyranopterin phosphate synthase